MAMLSYFVAILRKHDKSQKPTYTICTQTANGVGNIFEQKHRLLYGA
jgi:hypothetical protein